MSLGSICRVAQVRRLITAPLHLHNPHGETMFKSRVPREGHRGLIHLNVHTWYAARAICRMLHHNEEHEHLWRQITAVSQSDLVPGDLVYWREPEWNEIVRGTVRKAGIVPTYPDLPAKAEVAKNMNGNGKKHSKRR